MSKNEPNTVTTPGASASRSRSTQKVLDIQRRFIDASRVSGTHLKRVSTVTRFYEWDVNKRVPRAADAQDHS